MAPTAGCLKFCRNYLKWFPQCFKSSFSDFEAGLQIYLFGCSRGISVRSVEITSSENSSNRVGSD